MMKKTVQIDVVIDTNRTIKQAEELMKLLNSANLLADKLTKSLKKLRLDMTD